MEAQTSQSILEGLQRLERRPFYILGLSQIVKFQTVECGQAADMSERGICNGRMIANGQFM